MYLGPTPGDETHNHHHFLGQEPVFRQITDRRGEPTTIMLLNALSMKLFSKYLSSHPQIRTPLNTHQFMADNKPAEKFLFVMNDI